MRGLLETLNPKVPGVFDFKINFWFIAFPQNMEYFTVCGA